MAWGVRELRPLAQDWPGGFVRYYTNTQRRYRDRVFNSDLDKGSLNSMCLGRHEETGQIRKQVR